VDELPRGRWSKLCHTSGVARDLFMEEEGRLVGLLPSVEENRRGVSAALIGGREEVKDGNARDSMSAWVATARHSWLAGNPTTVAPNSSGLVALGSSGVDGR
jgi:hypothetical protein